MWKSLQDTLKKNKLPFYVSLLGFLSSSCFVVKTDAGHLCLSENCSREIAITGIP